MSYVLLHADRGATALADDPIVSAAEIGALQDAMALLAATQQVRGEAMELAKQEIESARSEGYAAGKSEGRAAAEEAYREELLRLAKRDQKANESTRKRIIELALQVVRHVAGEVGTPDVVAGIAERALASVAPNNVVTVRIATNAFAAAERRLGHRPGVTIEADPSLSEDDCVLETSLGVIHAGFSAQLAQIERNWAEDAH